MIEWTEEYSTGDQKIDSQHKQLFEFVNNLTNNVQTEKPLDAQKINIEFLGEYAKSHFCYEDACMSFYQCPAAQANKQEHQNFLEYYQTFSDKIKKFGIQPGHIAELQFFLENWLTSHIKRIDTKIKPCIDKA